MSATLNPRQKGTLPSNTVQNPKNDGQCMAVTTRSGVQTINPPMPQLDDDAPHSDAIEDDKTPKPEEPNEDGELSTKQTDTKEDKKVDEAKKAAPTPMSRPPPPFPQRLKKQAEDGKFLKFISMLKQISVNVPLIEALEQMPGYAKFMKDLVTKKRTASFEPADNIHQCSVIATRLLA